MVHGTEPKVDGQLMWDCTSHTHVAFTSILNVMGRHMLSEANWQGARSVDKNMSSSRALTPVALPAMCMT